MDETDRWMDGQTDKWSYKMLMMMDRKTDRQTDVDDDG